MSTTCIYKAVAVRVPAAMARQSADQFLLVELVGSNNCYEYSGRRARSWQLSAAGPAEVLIADAIYCASGFLGGMAVFGNFGSSGHLEPDQYIAKMRKLIQRAHTFDGSEVVRIDASQHVRLCPRNASDLLVDVLPRIFERVAQEAAQKRRFTGSELLRIEGST